MKILIALLIAATAVAEEPVKGRLCIAEPKAVLSEGDCRNVTGTTVEVTPAERAHSFVWTSANWKTIQIGTIAAKATNIALEDKDQREVKLSVRGEASRGWPADVEIVVGAKEAWRWVAPARAVVKLERIVLPAGRYTMFLKAEHHRIQRISLNATNPTNLGERRLEPLRLVRARVVGPDEKSLVATVSYEDGKPCTTSDEQGAFACEMPEPSGEESILISAAGFGTREVRLPRGTGPDIDLGVIKMTRGQALTVKLIRDPGVADSFSLTLDSDHPDKYDHSRIATRRVKEGDEEVRFEDLEPGKYLLVASGKEPFERLAVPAEVKSGEDAASELKIEPFRLEVSAAYGDDPMRNGRMEVVDLAHTWRQAIKLSDDGTYSGPMWQRGQVNAFVGDGPGMSELVSSPQLGADPSRWDIRITKREIVGRILDAEAGGPVADANIHLVAEFDERQGRLHTTVPVKDSAFSVLASKTGKYELTITAPNYIAKIVEVPIKATDATKTIEVALERGVAVPLEIVSSSGAPIPNVRILEGVQNEVNPQFILQGDGQGKFTLRGHAGETRVLYFVPPDGSFAVSRIQIPNSNPMPIQIVVPPPAGALRVRALDPEDKPVPTAILLRHNGMFIPTAILRFVTAMGTGRTGEGVLSRLPAGAYEVWAVGRFEDQQQLIASNGTLRPPVRVGLSAGEASVTVRAPKR